MRQQSSDLTGPLRWQASMNSNWLIIDLRRIREKLPDCTEIPVGPLALVTPLSPFAVDCESVNFRGLSSRNIDDSPVKAASFCNPAAGS